MTRKKTVFSILVGALAFSLGLHYLALREVQLPVWRVIAQSADPCQSNRPLDIEVYDPSSHDETVSISIRKSDGARRVDVELGRKLGSKDRFVAKRNGQGVSAAMLQRLLEPEGSTPRSDVGRVYVVEYRGSTDLLEIPACKEIPLELALNQPTKKAIRQKKPRQRPIRLRKPRPKKPPKRRPPVPKRPEKKKKTPPK
ncbi:MAG: hypothetical protein KC609_11690, partial [Myxococcales bacterium]|nr:hypothetical protein [Myxococcales bacterium]